MDQTTRFSLVGPGRAGTALSTALTRAGWTCVAVAGRDPERASTRSVAARLGARADAIDTIGADADLVVVATPDADVAGTAAALAPSLEPATLVIHLSGTVGLDAFAALTSRRPDVRVAGIHPLQTLAGTDEDAARLHGAGFAVISDGKTGRPDAVEVVEAAGGRPFAVRDRTLYHATAVIASNHLVALMGQVERLAAVAGVPADAFWPLVRTTLTNVENLGAAAALTGPVARGDADTVARHLDALPEDERMAYRALAREALRLVDADADAGPLLEVLASPVPEVTP